jgi:hypothetical protein
VGLSYPREISVRFAGLRADIWTRNPQNTEKEHQLLDRDVGESVRCTHSPQVAVRHITSFHSGITLLKGAQLHRGVLWRLPEPQEVVLWCPRSKFHYPLFFHWLYSRPAPWPLIFSFIIILQTVGLLGRVISSSLGLYLLNTGQHKHIPNIHALCVIRTHDPGFRASEDSTCLRPLGYRDRLIVHVLLINGSDSCRVISGYLFNNEPVRRCKHAEVHHC